MKEVMVDINNERIDTFLARKLDLSRNKVQKLIKQNKILVNGNKVCNNYLISENELITIDDNLDFNIHLKSQDIPLDIVYENDDLLIINKKSGMVTHPAPGNYENTLVNALLGKYQLSSNNLRPGIVHRLDKDTSGLMLVAKNDETHDKLSKMISEKKVKRCYLAFVSGVILNDTGTIDAPIGRDPKNREKMIVTDVNSKHAITHFKVLKRMKNHTLIECVLETGRTHQIRVHLSYIGYPICNDFIYGKEKIDNSFGQMLHSYKISFDNPRDNKHLEFIKDAPDEFYELIRRVENEENI